MQQRKLQRGRRRGALLVTGIMLLGAVGWAVWASRAPSGEERFADAMGALDAQDFARISNEIDALTGLPGFEDHVHVLRGGLFLRTGAPAQALEQFARVRPEGPLRIPLLRLTGEALYLRGNLAESEACFRALAADRPEIVDAHRWLGAIYYDLGNMDAAIRELIQVTQLSPDDYRPYRMLGLIYFDFERYAEAVTAYRDALARVPPTEQRAEIVTKLAQALIQQHEYAAALDLMTKIERNPGATRLALQSECQWNLGRREVAWKRLEQAAALDPALRSVLVLQGRFHLEAGDPDLAEAALRKALDQDPHDFESRFLLANAYRKQGRNGEYQAELARVEASRALRIRLSELNKEAIQRPQDAQVRHDLAALCAELGKDKLAAMWRRAAEAAERQQRVQSESQ